MAWKKKETASPAPVEKVLEVEAGMQGDLTFKDPINLRINGKFEGSLHTKGLLEIGRSANVAATISGDDIVITGRVKGEVTATRRLTLKSSASVEGNINAPRLAIEEGAMFRGQCHMERQEDTAGVFSLSEIANYLEVENTTVKSWADQGKIPAFKEGSSWYFKKNEIEKWVEAGGTTAK